MITTKLFSKNFIIFFLVIAQATFGTSVSAIALAFLVLKISGSPAAMAFTLGVYILPTIFMPFTATLLDRLSVKNLLTLSFFLRGIVLLLMFVCVELQVASINFIYLLSFCNGILATLIFPACQILIPSFLPSTQLERGNSLFSIAEQSMSLVGYLVGGLLVSVWGPNFVLLLVGVCYLVSFCLLQLTKVLHTSMKTYNSFMRDFVIGLQQLRQLPVVILITVMCFFINVFFAVVEVYLPLHMRTIAKGAAGYGVFMTCMMLGMLVSSVVIGLINKKFNTTLGIACGWLLLMLAFLGLGILNSFYFCISWGVAFGGGIALINISVNLIFQKCIQQSFRGRLSGMSMALSSCGMPLTFFLISYFINSINFDILFEFAASLAALFSIVWWYYNRSKPVVHGWVNYGARNE